jgi:hypothetical protein
MEDEFIKWIKEKHVFFSKIVSKINSHKKEDFTIEEEEFMRKEFDSFFYDRLILED